MNHLTKAGFAIAVGTAVLTATPDAKALNYSYGFSGTSSVSGSTYTLTSNPSSFTCSEGCSAFSDVLTAFGSFVYKINKLSATSAEWASPLTIALNPTATFGNSITFFNPITTFTAPNGTSFFTSDYKTDSGLSGELVSFTVNTPSRCWCCCRSFLCSSTASQAQGYCLISLFFSAPALRVLFLCHLIFIGVG